MSALLEAGDRASIPWLLRMRAERSADDTFISFEGQSVSYGGMLERAQRAANALAANGLGRADRIAVMLPNCLEFIDLWFGAAMLGAVLVPINTALRGEGLHYLIDHSGSKLLVADAPLAEIAEAASSAAREQARMFVHEPGGTTDRHLAALLDGGHPSAPASTVAPEQLASILYTSGTTGLPKGVMNCHNAYATAGREFAVETVRIRSDDVLYTTLPLFHINAQTLTVMGSIVSGRPIVLAPRFSASGLLDDVRMHGATVFNYIGAMLTMLYKQPARPDDAENPLRLTVGGAAPKELWRDFEERFACPVLEIYGLTETACFCLSSPPEDIRVGKIGTPVSWSEVRIERPDGTPAPPGERGEICIRSKLPDVMLMGYYGNEAATAEALRGGWFHSGDRGEMDADGYFTFVDRLKDSIRRRGENISSYEVERTVNEHPLVLESAAIAVPSELGEDEVMIVVVTKDGAELAPADLIEFCEQRMARFMVPRFVRFVIALPKTGTERVRKFLLREEGSAGAWDRQASS
ncbi:MAG TPA: ATP-dependent acyl-CoA ligase [Solirubrobacteraceae bacterium]